MNSFDCWLQNVYLEVVLYLEIFQGICIYNYRSVLSPTLIIMIFLNMKKYYIPPTQLFGTHRNILVGCGFSHCLGKSLLKYLVPFQGAALSNDVSVSLESGSSEIRQTSQTAEVDDVAKQLQSKLVSDYQHESNSATGRVEKVYYCTTRPVNNRLNSKGQTPKQRGSPSFVGPSCDERSVFSSTTSDRCSPSHFSGTPPVNTTYRKEASPNTHSGFQDGQFPRDVHEGKGASEERKYKGELPNLDDQNKVPTFDICLKSNGSVKLKSPLLAQNRAIRNDKKRQESGGSIVMLRPGLFLLKGHLSLLDQVNIFAPFSA